MHIFLFNIFVLISSNSEQPPSLLEADTIYQKQYPNIGRVGYYCEYLGTVARKIPEVKTENLVPLENIPIYGIHTETNQEKKSLIEKESGRIITKSLGGSYDILDETGQLYLGGKLIYEQNCTKNFNISCDPFNFTEYCNTFNSTICSSPDDFKCTDDRTFNFTNDLHFKCEKGQLHNCSYRDVVTCTNVRPRSLYKHYGSHNLYRGNISDSEPAVIKRITIHPRNFGYSLTGLYAPPGEIITVRISDEDLEAIGTLHFTIGQVLNNGQANNIWLARNFQRMPIITNTFLLNKNLSPHKRDGNDHIFFVGSFLGGPIYLKTDKKPSLYTVTISGGVKYPHFIKGYTTREEFESNFNTTTPYFDMEIWQHGIIHSGPRKQVQISSYDSFYETATYWEKVSGVSHQIPTSNDNSCTVNMIYEIFVAAGAAVAFPGRGTTNCPESWLTYVLDYPQYIVKASGDVWGPHHEFNHHYQNGWGLTDDGEVSNNADTLISYSFYTRISERRTEDNEPNGDGWNKYTSASFAVKDATSDRHDNQLVLHATLLHCLGQYIFIKATQKRYGRNTNQWHRSFTELTELDFTYFFRDVYKIRSLSDEEANKYADKNYKSFVPIACRYQTGIGYMIKGKRNVIHTMRPFVISYGKTKLLNFTKQIFVPKDIQYEIKNITQPPHGTIEKQSENIYLYRPDVNHLDSGEFTLTLSLTKIDDPNFLIDDVEIYIELRQSYELRETFTTGKFRGQRKLDTKIYWYPEGEMPMDPVSAFENNYSGSEGFVDIMSNSSIGDSNTEIWFKAGEFLPNRISEIRGKFEVKAKSYQIALRGRYHCALFLSFDNGKTYELAANISDYNDDLYHLDNPKTYHNYTFDQPQWVYFKGVMVHTSQGVKSSYIGVGLGEIKANGQSSVSNLNAYEETYQKDNVNFTTEDKFPRVWKQAISKKWSSKGKLLKHQYKAYTAEGPKYSIENLFDEDNNNEIHTLANSVSTSTPFSVLVDLGETITANQMTLIGNPSYHHYYAKTFTLYVGNDLNDMHLLANVTASTYRSNNVVVKFDPASFRYYELNVTATYANSNYLAFRYIEFSNQFNGELVSLDDKRVSLYNTWEKKNAVCAFGMIYIGQKDSKAEFKFNGTRIGIKSYTSAEYGKFRVLIDGALVATVDLNQSLNQVCLVYKNEHLENKEHSIVIQGINKFNIESFVYGPDLTSVDETVNDPFLDFTVHTLQKSLKNSESLNSKVQNNESKTMPIVFVAVLAIVASIAIVIVACAISIKKKTKQNSFVDCMDTIEDKDSCTNTTL